MVLCLKHNNATHQPKQEQHKRVRVRLWALSWRQGPEVDHGPGMDLRKTYLEQVFSDIFPSEVCNKEPYMNMKYNLSARPLHD